MSPVPAALGVGGLPEVECADPGLSSAGLAPLPWNETLSAAERGVPLRDGGGQEAEAGFSGVLVERFLKWEKP